MPTQALQSRMLVALVMLLASPVAVMADELTKDEVLALFEGAVGAIKSFDLHTTVTTRRLIITEAVVTKSPDGRRQMTVKSRRKLKPGEEPQTTQKQYRQLYLQGRGRIDFLEQGTGKAVLVYDQEQQKLLEAVVATGKPVILASLLYPFSRLVGIERVGALATAARRVLRELKARADPPVPQIRFITGDILKQDFSDAGVVYSHATAFTYELMDQVEERLHSLPRGARVALVGKTLASKAFAFKKGQVCEMNWGPSLASLYVRT